MTSTTFISGTGLKKWKPAKRCGRRNPAAMAGRTLGAHLATGGVAGLIVLVTEQGLGNKGRSTLHGPLADVVLGGLVATAQTRTLRRAAATLTLPTSQYRTGRLPR